MKVLKVLEDIKQLFTTKADNLSYSNGQLQLTSENKPIGLPLSIVTGGSINSFVSGVNNGIFTASTGNISTFTVSDYVSTKILTLIKENYVLVQNKDFSINNDGLVTLNYPLEQGQFVAWIMMNTSYDYGDLANKPVIKPGGVTLQISETEPITELISGLVWFRPSTRSISMYIDTVGFIKLNSSDGEVVMIEQVYKATAPTSEFIITIPDLSARDVLIVDHDGATLYEGINYSIDYAQSKFILISHALKINESIHIVCIRITKGSTAVLDKSDSIYTATTAGITMVPINIIGFDVSQIYIVDHDGAILHEGINYEILPDMKTIKLLNFSLAIGEKIHVMNIKMISSEATKAMLDDMRLKVTDVVSKVETKINKVDIVNNLTAGGSTKVLSAEQGKLLNTSAIVTKNTADSVYSEVTNARTSASRGTVFPTLAERVEVIDAEVTNVTYGTMSNKTGGNFVNLYPINTCAVYGSVVGNTMLNTQKNLSLDNTTDYSVLHGIMTAPNNVLRVLGDGSNVLVQAYQQLNYRNDKWYINLKIRPIGICNYIKISIVDASNVMVTGSTPILIDAPVANQWYDVSQIITLPAPTQTGVHRIMIHTEYPTASASSTKGFEVQRGIVVAPMNGLYYSHYTADKLGGLISNVSDNIMNSGNMRLKSVGLNSYDGKLYMGGINAGNGENIISTSFFRSGYIRVMPGKYYYHNIFNGVPKFSYYDRYKKFINTGFDTLTKIPEDACYIRFVYAADAVNVDIMINTGTSLLSYIPYRSTEMYIPMKLCRLPNGTYDEFTFSGKYIKRIESKIDQSGVVNYSDMKSAGLFMAKLSTGIIQVGNKGETLANTASVIYYELANPIVSNYNTGNNMVVEKGGTVFIENVQHGMGQYTASGIFFNNGIYPITSVLNVDVVSVLDPITKAFTDITPQCVLNGTNNGITSTSCKINDIVSYEVTVDTNDIYPNIIYMLSTNLAGDVNSIADIVSTLDKDINTRHDIDGLRLDWHDTLINSISANVATKVPTTRTINSKPLSSDISLVAGDVNAYTKAETYTKGETNTLVSAKMNISGGTFTGLSVAQNNTSYGTKQLRNITLSTSDPSGGANGDIWIKYV